MSIPVSVHQDTGTDSESDEAELPHKLVNSQLDLFWSAECADCTIKCNALEWPVHRSVLSHGCKWFKTALVGDFQEAKTSVLDMAEDDPHAVEGLLIYVYTLEYPEWVVALNEDGNDAGGKIALKAGKSTVPTARWETHLSLFKLADKICLRKLKAMAKKRLQSIMHTEWTLGSFHQLLEQLWHMQHVGVEELKAVAMKVVSANAADLMVKPQFRDLLSDDSSFNIDLINELISGPKGTSTGVENELMLARQRGERNRNDLQEVANSWATGPFCSVTNKGNVGRVLENWDKT